MSRTLKDMQADVRERRCGAIRRRERTRRFAYTKRVALRSNVRRPHGRITEARPSTRNNAHQEVQI
jgi:hypothetical protein